MNPAVGETPARPQGFLDAFDTLTQAVRRARGTSLQGTAAGLSLSQYALLSSLSDREFARVRELATDAGITPPTASRILDALERRGIVMRTRSGEDRRAVSVALTDDGRRLLSAHTAWIRGRQRAFFEALPEAERALAPDLLLRLSALIDELADGPEHSRRTRAVDLEDPATP